MLGWKKPNINQATFENRTFSFSLQPRSLWSFNLFYFLIYKDDDSDLPSSPPPLLSTRNSQILQITAVIIRKDTRNIFNENFRVWGYLIFPQIVLNVNYNECIRCRNINMMSNTELKLILCVWSWVKSTSRTQINMLVPLYTLPPWAASWRSPAQQYCGRW